MIAPITSTLLDISLKEQINMGLAVGTGSWIWQMCSFQSPTGKRIESSFHPLGIDSLILTFQLSLGVMSKGTKISLVVWRISTCILYINKEDNVKNGPNLHVGVKTFQILGVLPTHRPQLLVPLGIAPAGKSHLSLVCALFLGWAVSNDWSMLWYEALTDSPYLGKILKGKVYSSSSVSIETAS